MSNSSTVSELDGLVGLESAKKLVKRLASNGDLVHAVMFYGVNGAGKRSMARILAKAWQCLTPTTEGACGVCRPCLAFEHGNGVDLLEIGPKPPSNLIKIGAIVEVKKPEDHDLSIQEFFRTAPLICKRKIVIMRSADRMNGAAANALLKTLEEPPGFAKLILTTASVGHLPATIISRCVMIKCELPDPSAFMNPELNPRLIAAEDRSPGRLRLIGQHTAWYESMLAFSDRLRTLPRSAALMASEDFKSLCDQRQETFHEAARNAQEESLRVLANLLENDSRGTLIAGPIAEAHRRIIGNGNSGLVLDSLFAQLLAG